MVYLQVENCNQRFERLKTLKNNEWIDPDLNVVKEKKISKLSSMVSKKPKEKCVNSALSAMLKEARKKIRNETKENKAEGRSPMVRCVTPRRSTWVVSANIDYLINLLFYLYVFIFHLKRLKTVMVKLQPAAYLKHRDLYERSE